MSRRSSREGSVYKYKTPGGATRWRFQIWVPSEVLGKKERLSQAGFKSATDANAALHEVIVKIKKHERVVRKSDMPTFTQQANTWLAGLVSHEGATIQGYQKNLRNHLLPYIGHLKLDDLTPALLSTHFSRLSKTGRKDSKDFGGKLGNNTLHKVGTVVSLILESAVDNGVLAVNAMRKVKLGSIQRVHQEEQVWSIDQINLFLSWNQSAQQDDLNPLWRLIAYTGLRRGEALALKWSDIDLPKKRLKVLRSTDSSEPHSTKEPKTKSSRRSLMLDEQLVARLKAYKSHRAQLGWGLVDPDSWVFGGLNGQLRVANDVSARWARMVNKAVVTFGKEGLPRVTIKGLRHSHATALLEMGVHPKVIQERLGHSTFKLTMDTYSHVTETMQANAIQMLDELLSAS